jgi:hypothetical protein
LNIEDLKQGMTLSVRWTDGDETVGKFLRLERGYVVIQSDDGVHACLPSHLEKIEVLNVGET